MNPKLLIIISVFILINISAFIIMLADKIQSINPGSKRISEGMLFFLAAAFGSLGIYAGMFVCRHKTRKWYFLIGIPLLFLENLALLYLIYLLWRLGLF